MLYKGSKLVTVVPDPPLALGLPITWLLPPFYSMSHLLPSRGGLTYTMLGPCKRNGALIKQEIEETISIEGSRVMTGRNDDLGCIQVKDQGTGREEIAACIRVAKVNILHSFLLAFTHGCPCKVRNIIDTPTKKKCHIFCK